MTIEMINKNRFRVANDKKLLRKIGKQWVTVSALTLMLLGGGALVSSIVTHAASTTPAVEAQDTNNVKKQLNSNLDKAYQATQSANGSSVASSSASSASASSANKPSNIQSQATNMYHGLMMNAANNSNSTSVSSTSSKSSVASSSSASSKPSFNSAYHNYMAKMSGTDAKVASANDSNAENNNNKVNHKKPLLLFSNDVQTKASDGHWIYDDGKYISSMPSTDDISDGTYKGLTYKYDKTLQALEFTGGKIDTHGNTYAGTNAPFVAYFLAQPQFGGSSSDSGNAVRGSNSTLQSVKFGNINMDNVTNMSDMFFDDSKLRYLDLGNHFNTSNVTNMSSMFGLDNNLQSINFGNSFNTSNVTNMQEMFMSDWPLKTLTLPNTFNTSRVTNMSGMFKDDRSLQSLDLGSNFNTSNVTDMNVDNNFFGSLSDGMFQSDSNLQLTLPNSFNTSKVTNMSDMFWGVQSLILPSTFDTSKVTNMKNMFFSDVLSKITIQSPNTKISDRVGSDGLPQMNKLITPTDMASTSNDFSKGNLGTFIKPQKDYIYFIDKSGNYISDETKIVRPNANENITVQAPSGYQYINGDTGTFNSNNSDIHFTVAQKVTDRIIFNGDSNANATTHGLMGQRGTINAPSGYHFTDGTTQESFTYDGGTHTFDVASNYGTDKIVFNGDPSADTTMKGLLGQRGTINAPKGYHFTDGTTQESFTYDGGTHTFDVASNYGTDKIVFNGDPSADTTMKGLLGQDGTVNAPSGYHFTDGTTQESFTYDGGTHTFDVALPDKIIFHDIYNNIDGKEPLNSVTKVGASTDTYAVYAPYGWAIVNSDGLIANGKNSIFDDGKSFKYNTGNHVIDVAPVDNGLTYKYNKVNNSVEFTGGTLSDMLMPNNTNVKNATSIKFDDDIDTSHCTDMSNMFAGCPNLQSIDLGNNFKTHQVTNMMSMFSGDKSLKSLEIPNSFNINNVTNMVDMFSSDKSLKSLKIPSDFDTSNVTNMSDMFGSDGSLQSLSLPESFNTNKVTNMSQMFFNDGSLQSLKLPSHFNTNGVYNKSNSIQPLELGIFFMDNKLHTLVIQSPGTKFDKSANAPTLYKQLPQKDTSDKNYTLSTPNDFSKGSVGTFIRPKNVAPVRNTEATHQEVRYINTTAGAQMATSGQFAGQYNNQSPVGPVVGIQGVNNIGVVGQDDVLEPEEPIVKGQISIIYVNEDTGIQIGNTDTISGNIGSTYNFYQGVHQYAPTGYAVDDEVAFPNANSRAMKFIKSPQPMYIPVKPVSNTPDTSSNNSNNSNPNFPGFNIPMTNSLGVSAPEDSGQVYKILRVPAGYTLVNNENPFKLADNGVYNVAVQSKTVSDKVQFINEQNEKPMGSPISSNGAFDTLINTSNIKVPSHYMIDNSNPENQKLMKNGKLNIIHDGTTHNVYIKQAPSFINVIEYIDNNGQGSDVGDTSAYGQEGTDVPDKVIKDDVPKDYQLSPSQTLPVQFTKDNVIKVAVQSDNHNSDMVVGTAFLTLLYQKGNRTDGKVLRLHINGNIGDSDIVINPQDYDKLGYSVASSDNDWPISFKYSDVTKFTHDFSRYNREHTFIYEAKPVDIDIKYVDTQTGQSVTNPVNNQNVTAYDGDTIDLEDSNASNGIISVDGHDYNLQLPTGYHLAHTNNYIKVASNGSYVKKESNGVGGYRMLRMPLMKLTLGITPHFDKHNTKPTSNSSVAPVKPSSASSVTPQSASSASTEPSSASITPSSASQSVVPSISTASSMIAPSSTASVAPVTYSVAPSSIAPVSISTKPSSISTNKTIARSVIRHASHKHATKQRVRKPVTTKHAVKSAAKHDSERLNHQITQGKHKLNIVEHHMKARKATEIKMAHMLVHAKKTIKRSKHKLTYLRHNKRHVKHALRRITRNKVAIKHAKRVVRTAKQARPKFVHAKAATVEPTTDEPAATSVKASVATPKVHAKSTVTTYTSRKKLPQTSEATDHAGIVAIILMVMSVILAGFDKAFSREHNE